MKSKNQGQLKTQVGVLKREVKRLESEVLNAKKASPAVEVVEELQGVKAQARQLAENCKHYREKTAAQQDLINHMDDEMFNQTIAMKEQADALKRGDKELNAERWKVAGLEVELAQEQRKFNWYVGTLAVVVLVAVAVEGARLVGAL